TPTDARNFLSLAHRMGRTEEVMPVDPVTEITVEGRRVAVGSFPISVDVDRIDEMVRNPATREAANAFRASLGSPKHLLLGVDRLDYTKGIDARLKAFEELLRDGTLDPAEVAFVQVATPSRDDVRGYSNTRTEIEQLVGSINGNFAQLGKPVLHYLHQSLPFEDLVHLFLAADVMLVTPFQDGMNLVAKEYIACRSDGTGVLVLSEFAGTAVELHQALLCNPFDTAGMKRVIETALTLPVEEQRHRVRAMRTHLWANTVHDWAEGFFRHLDDVHPRGQRG
ncbi:MAG TPA: trehalose-6-phosphate synthase, partial [Acidimicrobiaceae bacterium]|nr:trehalose-6-phosphate synthase [Acidimicrobiaceae bacterium]